MKKEGFSKFNLTPLSSYNLEKVFASIIIDIRRPKNYDRYPVKYRVTYNQKQHYYPATDLTLQKFNDLHEAVGVADHVKTKKLIFAGFKRITDNIEELTAMEGFTLEGLDMRLKKRIAKSVLTAFENKITNLEEKSKIGTSIWYSCAKNSIEKFTTKNLTFAEITPTWLENYEAHLSKDGKVCTTISIYMRALRAIINNAKARGIISEGQYPFAANNNGKYRIPEGMSRKIALDITQLKQVFKYPILLENEKYRDLWIFSFYCNGINIGDMLRLKYENIVGNYIEWHRANTKVRDKIKIKIRAAITPEMQTIIERYGIRDKPFYDYIFPYSSSAYTPTPELRTIIERPSIRDKSSYDYIFPYSTAGQTPTPEMQTIIERYRIRDKNSYDYIFPYLTAGLTPTQERMMIQNVTHLINKKMRAIGLALGIGGITTSCARHTWASISRRKEVSTFAISKGMGHRNLSTTEQYLDSLSDDEINENAIKLPRMKLP